MAASQIPNSPFAIYGLNQMLLFLGTARLDGHLTQLLPSYTHFHPTTLSLFVLPIEVRRKIYSELHVHSGLFTFPPTFSCDLSSRVRPKRIDLYPTLLRTSKQVYGEGLLASLYRQLLSLLRFRRNDHAHFCSADWDSSKCPLPRLY